MIIGGGYIGMEVAAATTGWNLDTTVIINYFLHFFRPKDERCIISLKCHLTTNIDFSIACFYSQGFHWYFDSLIYYKCPNE